MAEDHLKRSASFRSSRRDDPSFEEDPLIELARIVAEDGGFRRHRAPELRPARNEPARRDPPMHEESIASQLEAELLESWDMDDGGAAPQPQRPVAEPHAAAGAGLAQSVHAPAPASGSEHRQRPAFPEIVIEDARRPPSGLGDGRREMAPPPRQEAREPFEEELSALFSNAEAPRAAEAAHAPGGADDAATALGQYEEPYGASYSAEIHDYDAFQEPDPDTDGPFGEEEAAELAAVQRQPVRRRRSYRGLIAAVGVLGVVLIGGAVAALVGGVGSQSDAGPPPVIRAEAGPAKVAPEETAEAQAGDSAGQAVYDRVAGRAPKDDEKLVDRAEEPRQVSRIVLPEPGASRQPQENAAADAATAGEPPADAAAEAGQDAAASQESIAGSISSDTARSQNGPRIDPMGPRRVRTVTVRPDGSIAAVPAPVRVAEAARPQGQVETDFSAADAPDPVPVRTVRIEGDGEPAPRSLESGPARPEAEAAAAPQPLVPSAASRQPASAARDDNGGAGADTGAAAEPAAEPAEAQLAMLPRARPDEVPAAFRRPAAARQPEPQRAEPRQAAAPRSGQPVDLLAAGPAAPRQQAQPARPTQQAARPAPSGSTPFAVQLSAQRSEDQARATFASLRSRYPSILGSQQAQIERADLGERGIYYRVRVGAGSQAEASQLCERLKAAGGSCFVTR